MATPEENLAALQQAAAAKGVPWGQQFKVYTPPAPPAPGTVVMPVTEIASPGNPTPPSAVAAPRAAPFGGAVPSRGLINGVANALSAINPMPPDISAPAQKPLTGADVAALESGATPGASAVASAAGATPSQPAAPPPDANGMIPPATYVPAHFDPSRVPVTPETQKAIEGTFDAQAGAQRDLAQAQEAQAQITADDMAQEAERQRQSAANMAAKEVDRQAFVKSRIAQLDQASQDFAKQQVNPEQWWDSRNLFQKAMAGISIALGGGVAAVRGGQNMGTEMINNAIQQNIAAQQTNLELKRVGLAQQSNVLDQYRQAFGDDRMGDLALEHAMRESAIEKMSADAAANEPGQINAGAQNAIAQLERQQDMTRAQFEQLAYVKAHMVGGPGVLQKTDPALLVKVPGTGETVQAPTKEEAIEARKRAGAAQNITDIINRALAIRREAKLGNLTDSYQELEALQENYKLQAALFNSGGNRMNASDVDAMNKAAGAFTGVIGNNDAVMEHARDRIKQQFTNELRAMGSEQVQRGYRVTPQGIEPGIAYKGQSDTPRGGGTGATSSFKPAGQ